mmetsp:Transcript_5059/g.8136  ORF Transcript_5059/g.8136 Transcript_5059/m.8136 type:complete len:113 (+) Transcript_5059:239-577(+)|eukprot:CAMPEP_0184317056 /NCGR_PEP_ID=MMETSP1049-20130417/94190_1 /TAXON_ID=77928 /ORGANISM="Proteomonas sulcata, Strain CCMP704" /LENGTH=112 /DNA_ID=CAMNT_0026636287 /DNA_START=106 /DNA_END=444 /DNA_ORIENTATION=+
MSKGGGGAYQESVSFLPRLPKSPSRKADPDDDDKRNDPVSVGLVKVKQCGLCGLEFEEHNLPGVVSFQAIANLRKKWGAGLPMTDARLRSASARYSSVKLCAFCYQFFYDSE